ncbi:MAG: endonuclease domain-containing protein [Candidatus Moranbacteria bacterium]|nr:endonuclease domain-containing protein [Candidatus Moranbacteria bacterium]
MHNKLKPKEILTRVRGLRQNQTPQEVILWSRLKNRRLCECKFRRQYLIGKYIADFICLEKKLIVEVDGWQHKIEEARRYDRKRTEYLKKEGFAVLRFWNNDVNSNLDGVIFEIERALTPTLSQMERE